MKRPSLAFLALLVPIVAAGCVGGVWLWVHVAEAGGWLRACVALGLVAVFPVGMWRAKVAADRYDQREAMQRIEFSGCD